MTRDDDQRDDARDHDDTRDDAPRNVTGAHDPSDAPSSDAHAPTDETFDTDALEGLALVEDALHAGTPSGAEADSLLERGEIPRRFDGLELKHRIGRGGMGEVYLARQLSLDRDVAVKLRVAPSCDSVDVDALLAREARTLASLEHPGIVRVLDAGSVSGRRYLVMEQVRGRTLRAWLERRPQGLPPAAAVAIARGIADALAAAHAVGVVHRDLKPSNVLVGRATGAPARVRLVDFGIAGRAFDLSGPRELGTWEAMAPEQRAGEAVGPPADVYALGVLLSAMVGGRDDVPGALHRLVARFTAVDPARRPADGAAARAELADPKLAAARAAQAPARVSWFVAAALVLLVNLLGFWWLGDDGAHEPAAADATLDTALPPGDPLLPPGGAAALPPALRRALREGRLPQRDPRAQRDALERFAPGRPPPPWMRPGRPPLGADIDDDAPAAPPAGSEDG